MEWMAYGSRKWVECAADMTDIIDQANDHIEREMKMRLEHRRASMLPATGECLNCGEHLDGERRFCDVDCRDDYDKRQRLKKGPA